MGWLLVFLLVCLLVICGLDVRFVTVGRDSALYAGL